MKDRPELNALFNEMSVSLLKLSLNCQSGSGSIVDAFEQELVHILTVVRNLKLEMNELLQSNCQLCTMLKRLKTVVEKQKAALKTVRTAASEEKKTTVFDSATQTSHWDPYESRVNNKSSCELLAHLEDSRIRSKELYEELGHVRSENISLRKMLITSQSLIDSLHVRRTMHSVHSTNCAYCNLMKMVVMILFLIIGRQQEREGKIK